MTVLTKPLDQRLVKNIFPPYSYTADEEIQDIMNPGFKAFARGKDGRHDDQSGDNSFEEFWILSSFAGKIRGEGREDVSRNT